MMNVRAKTAPRNSGMGELRRGYTTGSCAAAAAKAAAYAMILERPVSEVEIALPSGRKVTFAVHDLEYKQDWAMATVIKDAGDDPDVTGGAEIGAEVRFYTK